MTFKRPSIPMHAFRPGRWRSRWPWALVTVLMVLLIWLAAKSPGEYKLQAPTPVGTAQIEGPPWRMGNSEGRFTLTLYADLECPFCRAYFRQIKRWVSENKDVSLQWHHMPLTAHEPAASAEARLAECAAEANGNGAFWQAIEWIYAHTRADGQGLPDGLRYPYLTPAIEQCLASARPDVVIRAQTADAIKRGVAATPSVGLQDRQTNHEIILQGPIEGDALQSAMDMLSTDDQAAPPVKAPSTPDDTVGDMPK
ncbi:thioredoxin domain-containing protein [Pseudomonas sp. CBSPBW29]|uniref:DsbA family protein n=1 Tax=Pseudomonas sp. CBS TaxID=2971912 RepID=UPI0021ACBF84|nr:thioredoxin domain-containing protein [Pseudomonas sp. CBS]WEL43484.1 thioredoxin domain-containing protein [Pseudomonas sp. CBSPBW29]WEL64551.1 thioredoxin domain-containing protein [Pseudomonas sp. CBSPGW29]WEL68023.1 thioredoxin domain-containing protein [Pseudomonas sp. CBSPCGW29]WEL75042.1 thioredoxin domain-containing protein [Pseudomonas sp. CBSPAW29]WEL80714.1 thioredoxin domain-containing protein [Pseudomonas sp. CBSPCAW29]WEL89233.1 thioredoxin domain-containing protein [Pseudomo